MRKILLLFSSLLIFLNVSDANEQRLKFLHLTFHRGCAKEIESLAEELSFDVETWFIPDLPKGFFDEAAPNGNTIYNMGHERAERIWNRHKDYFLQFDGILTSDTAPLARIFLQNHFSKPLIVWICNRFDYSDQASLDCPFPDPEYYQLFNEAQTLSNVTLIAYTAFEHHYARSKGVETGDLVITPCAIPIESEYSLISEIPTSIQKNAFFFLPPYHNETHFMNLKEHCKTLGISAYAGRYNGPFDLKDFKGIIHLPYAWSNLALFENMGLGIPYLIPSRQFLETLAKQGAYFFYPDPELFSEGVLELSEWYSGEHSPCIVYFNSWSDLQAKCSLIDFDRIREEIKQHALKNHERMIERWRTVFAKHFKQ